MIKTLPIPNKLWATLALSLIAIAALGCGDDNPTSSKGEKSGQITTVTLFFDEVGTVRSFFAKCIDLDGPGGTAPIFGSLEFRTGMTYNGNIELFNEN